MLQLLVVDMFSFFLVPPRIEHDGPMDRKVTVHDTVELPCKAEGVPKPRITWQKGTRVLSNAVGERKQKIVWSQLFFVVEKN